MDETLTNCHAKKTNIGFNYPQTRIFDAQLNALILIL